jgi:hypothetical protein
VRHDLATSSIGLLSGANERQAARHLAVYNETSPAQSVSICLLKEQTRLAHNRVRIKYSNIGEAYRDTAYFTASKILFREQCVSLLTVLQGEIHMIESKLNIVT